MAIAGVMGRTIKRFQAVKAKTVVRTTANGPKATQATPRRRKSTKVGPSGARIEKQTRVKKTGARWPEPMPPRVRTETKRRIGGAKPLQKRKKPSKKGSIPRKKVQGHRRYADTI